LPLEELAGSLQVQEYVLQEQGLCKKKKEMAFQANSDGESTTSSSSFSTDESALMTRQFKKFLKKKTEHKKNKKDICYECKKEG
ncbi:hypothetical protein DVA76_19360, partial [Acinetobacter baumannii]